MIQADIVTYYLDQFQGVRSSQRTDVEEALANLKEATELYLEEFPLPETGRPLLQYARSEEQFPQGD